MLIHFNRQINRQAYGTCHETWCSHVWLLVGNNQRVNLPDKK